MADACMFAEVDLMLAHLGIGPGSVAAVHSTSWRQEGPRQINTFMAVIKTGDFALERWPALPITVDLAEAVGKPFTHAPSEPPVPRYVDVLMHGLRHLRFLLEPGRDATTAAAMGDLWRRHLEPLDSALATMYDVQHQAV